MSEIVKETPEPKDDTMRRVTPVVFSITFVRHGETKANREQRIQGHLDIPLSSVGEMQASQVGTRLCKADFTRVYASDLCRAYSTCELILKENSCKPPPIKIDTRLRERNFGSVEGMSLDDVKVMAAAEGLTWPDFNPSGSETLGVLQGRMVSFFKELSQSVYDKNKHRTAGNADNFPEDREDAEDMESLEPLEEVVPVEKILVVSHGAALKQLYVHLHKTLGCQLPGDPDIINRISPNTGITEYIVRFSPKKYGLHCVRIHDGDHLQDL
ncbi:fructose-2,6-bisphosphatase TIGAR-like [Homarus americanus]|uniref:fructose-2,6-bisphosphatase TIGAR-like n=1 Tax=Homarus americanus TaxID=6706 RepID=UPI001C47F339|nr:fructose-2,6-bisphosphatase TIGAR-like [Homarus americanus]